MAVYMMIFIVATVQDSYDLSLELILKLLVAFDPAMAIYTILYPLMLSSSCLKSLCITSASFHPTYDNLPLLS